MWSKILSPRVEVVSAVNVHLSEHLVRLLLGVSSNTDECIEECVARVLYCASGRSTQVVLSLLFNQLVLDLLGLLLHAVVHVNFLLLVPAPGVVHAYQSILFVSLQFLSVQKFRILVPVSEEERHGSALLSVLLGVMSVLHHRSHGSYSGAQTHHDVGIVLALRDGDSARIHLAHQLILAAIVPQVVRCHTVAIIILVVIPVVVDDA